MDHLLRFLKSNSSSSIPSVSIAQTGDDPITLYLFPWIIDSGASDHTTSSPHLFDTHSPCLGNEKVRMVDSSFSSIAGKGLIKISENIYMCETIRINLSY